MKDKGLKLFVWDGEYVLLGYTSGLICVLAHDLAEALRLLEEKAPHVMGSFPVNDYKVVEGPEAFYVWGGG